ncbi:hypothetical protein ACX1M8_00530 [Mycoplasma sp. VS31B]
MIEAQQQGETLYSRLIYASIMRERNLQTDGDGRTETDTLSIKFRKTELNIEIGDYIYRDKKIYNIISIDKDLFNLQEQKVTAVFYKNLEAMPIIKNYLQNLQNEEIKKADTLLIKDAESITKDINNIRQEIRELKEYITEQINQLNQKQETLNEIQKSTDTVKQLIHNELNEEIQKLKSK